MDDVTAESRIRSATTQELLSTIKRLTHRMHGYTPNHPAEAPLRRQRDRAEAEILRRVAR